MSTSVLSETTAIENGPEMFTPRELATWLRYRTSHVVYVAIRSGALRAIRAGENGALRIRKADAIAWLRDVQPST